MLWINSVSFSRLYDCYWKLTSWVLLNARSCCWGGLTIISCYGGLTMISCYGGLAMISVCFIPLFSCLSPFASRLLSSGSCIGMKSATIFWYSDFSDSFWLRSSISLLKRFCSLFTSINDWTYSPFGCLFSFFSWLFVRTSKSLCNGRTWLES